MPIQKCLNIETNCIIRWENYALNHEKFNLLRIKLAPIQKLDAMQAL